MATTTQPQDRKANPFRSVGGRVVSRPVSRHPGYELRRIEIDDKVFGQATLIQAFTRDGHYLGDEETARFLVEEKGIAPELHHPEAEICAIGYSESDGRWYGWSHRSIRGYAIGDVLTKDDLATRARYSEEWIAEHPEDDRSLPVGFEIRSRDDARRCAIAFADAVS